ncbi:TonB-dependent receptor [Oxalicibacterium faecigallinarum]|uniref:TonB-dependent receptor n=1 Tax=Oxalicibacterium faecigallinarum TaxID=573741 RepID=A0A8J3AU03_9BURK|nr:TonB-dependent siderophore receptor [Oxalicibacterium faecigallinarum]GGI18592.1 TonB-dependent receptor [Oxalicibacterium faecigallinarum]
MASRTPSLLKPTLIACAIQAALPILIGTAYAQTTEATTTQLEEITVTSSADASAEGLSKAYSGGQVARGGRAGILGTQDNMDTPFSITSYTNELIKNQNARSVADVVQNDPAVRVSRGFGNFQELYVIRGFPVYSDDVAYNGLYGMLPRQFVATELIERVEVFRGANTFLNGAAPAGSGIGGAINLLPKRAANEALTQATLGFEGRGQVYGALDLSRRFGPDQSTGIRLNAAKREGETGVQNEERKLDVLAIGLDWRNRNTRLSADIGYQKHRLDRPQPSVTPVGGIPNAPDASKNFGQPWTFSEEKDVFGTFRGELDLSDSLTAWGAIGIRNGDEYNSLANPRSTASGALTTSRFDNVREETAKTAEIGIRGQFNTGNVKHKISVSAATFSLEKRNAFATSAAIVPASNLYEFVPAPAPAITATGNMTNPVVQAKDRTSSIAIADTMAFINERLLVTVGARHQTIESETFDYNTGTSNNNRYSKGRITPVAGIVYKANEKISVYANYIEALVKGAAAPATDGGQAVLNAGQVLAPYQSKQTEIGLKYDAKTFGASIAAYRTKRPNAYVQNLVFALNGEQKNQGIELSIYGEPLKGLRLLGGVTYMDAKQEKTAGGTYDGKKVIGIPDVQANVGAEWNVPGINGLAVTGRVVYTDSQYATQDNSLSIPSWTRLDVGARYLTEIGGKLVTWRARVDNVTDRNYWAAVGGASVTNNYLVLGAPRTISLTASVDF